MHSLFSILRQLSGEKTLAFQEGQIHSKTCREGKGQEQVFKINRHAGWKPSYWRERCFTFPFQSFRENPLLQTLVLFNSHFLFFPKCFSPITMICCKSPTVCKFTHIYTNGWHVISRWKLWKLSSTQAASTFSSSSEGQTTCWSWSKY